VILARTNRELNDFIGAQGVGATFVPTMGALHAGHEHLVRIASQLAESRGAPGCIVSIFVNPTQFNDPADFARYPKTLEADCALCEQAGAACVFAPAVEDIYPSGAQLPMPPVPDAARLPRLEDASRPGHFEGVCQVVSRLFDLVRPSAALLGEKDWQQLQVVRVMTRQQERPIEIIGIPTVREPDGLAMSSRNRFLTAPNRQTAIAVSRALFEGRKGRTVTEGETIMRWTLARHGIVPDYCVIREAHTLMPIDHATPHHHCRALIAAPLGSVRLLDNGPWNPCAE
jgi:pantoate--beta-alanine ligase